MLASNINHTHLIPPDKIVASVSLALFLIGAIAVSSASVEYSDRYFGNPWHYAFRHSIYMLLSLGLGVLAYLIPIRFWLKSGIFWLLIAVTLLILVLIPGVGKEINGSQRWLSLGAISFQPSEFAKCAMIIFLSGYLVRQKKWICSKWTSFIKPILIMFILAVLLLMEPDFGAVVVLIGATFTMLFLAGVKLIHFFSLTTIAIISLASLALSAPYRVQRLVTYVDPWSDPYGNGFQLVQSLIAFGRGEWFGVGLGNSVQKLFYLPEAHTDFVFSIWAEESGAIGALFVIFLYSALVGRIFWIGHRAWRSGDLFGLHFCNGFAILISMQAIINIGVAMGLLPTKGITLPFMSWGGTSLLVTTFMLAIVLRIDNDFRSKATASA